MNAKEAAKADARAKLREWLKPGDTVYTILRGVSRSGMSRDISVVLIRRDEEGSEYQLHPNWLVGEVVGIRVKQGWNDALVLRGCGMDMGFHLVYETSARLFPDGFGCIGKGCPSNDHSNGDRDYTPHGNGMTPHLREVLVGADHWHRDGGYALRQRWL